jgi:hypothetical protein
VIFRAIRLFAHDTCASATRRVAHNCRTSRYRGVLRFPFLTITVDSGTGRGNVAILGVHAILSLAAIFQFYTGVFRGRDFDTELENCRSSHLPPAIPEPEQNRGNDARLRLTKHPRKNIGLQT